MEIRRLRLHNFRQHADTTIAFERGLTGIIGPNGAGKSTILEAIAWAMYGSSAARGTRDSIRRRGAPAKSRVEVELDFALGAHRYRIVRTLNGAELYQDDESAPVANSSSAVNEKIARLLGMTLPEFYNTYFTGQKELAIMAQMSAPERAQFLSRVLGYERLKIVQNRLKEERSALKASLQTAESGLIDLAALAEEERSAADRDARAAKDFAAASRGVEEAARRLTAEQPAWERIQRIKEEVRSLESDLKVADHQAIESRRTFETLDRDLADALSAQARREEILPSLGAWDGLVARRDELDRLAQSFAERRGVAAQLAEVSAAVAKADERLAQLATGESVSAAKTELIAAQTKLTDLEAAREALRTIWVSERQEATTQSKTLRDRRDELIAEYKRLKKLGADGICPTCGRKLGKDFKSVLDDLTRQGEEINFNRNYYESRIKQLAAEPEELVAIREPHGLAEREVKRLTGLVARLEAQVTDRTRVEREQAAAGARRTALEATLAATPTSYDEAEHLKVRAQIVALEPLRVQVVRLAAQAERASLLIPKAAEAEQTLSQAEARVKLLTERMAGLGWSPESFETARKSYFAAEAGRHTAEVARARAEAEVSAAQEHRRSVARRRSERNERVALVTKLQDETLLNEQLDRAFTDLREELNAALRPDLSDSASVLLSDLTGGRYTDLDLDEDYLATIIDDGEPKQVISGGEEDVANLALRLAISQMIADRAGQPFSLLILDEIFGSLDEEHRGAVVGLLRSLADRFPQVILITHIESVRDGFDRVIRINYDVERGIASAREDQIGEVADAAA
ncbi:MAG: SMC family ATPase [Gemmatimonadota bacterium]